MSLATGTAHDSTAHPCTAAERRHEALLRRHGGALLALARRLLGDRRAEDAVRDAFLAVFAAADDAPDDAELAARLRALVIDACAARLAETERAAADDERALEALVPRFDAHGRHAGTPPAGRAPSAAELRALIDRLPPVHRVAVLLCDALGLGPADAAAKLGLDARLLASRLHRARLALVALVARAVPADERALAS